MDDDAEKKRRIASPKKIARAGARRALQQAIEDEVAAYVNAHAAHRDDTGHRLVVRNGLRQLVQHVEGLMHPALLTVAWSATVSATIAG